MNLLKNKRKNLTKKNQRIKIDFSNCDRCGTCVSVCGADVITLAAQLHIDNKKCVLCQKCVTVCPFGALAAVEEEFI
ncbi:MAG: 4Fe-4S binding protein [Chitinispirillales bacterium]|nr:4Fe-4S binding protein [Chitinispirillales bacterium]